MADDIDLANMIFDSEVSRAVNKIRQSTAQGAKGTPTCIECGDDMPQPRQKMGFNLCVPCAEERERRKSLYAD